MRKILIMIGILILLSPIIYVGAREIVYSPYTPFAIDNCNYRNDTVDLIHSDSACSKKMCRYTPNNIGDSYCEYLGFLKDGDQ